MRSFVDVTLASKMQLTSAGDARYSSGDRIDEISTGHDLVRAILFFFSCCVQRDEMVIIIFLCLIRTAIELNSFSKYCSSFILRGRIGVHIHDYLMSRLRIVSDFYLG